MRLLVASLALALHLAPRSTPAQAPTLDAVIRAEDARGGTPEELAVLRDGAAVPDTAVRRFAVRALGRLERPDLVDAIAPALVDASPAVRRAAADAVAQAVARGGGVGHARQVLAARLANESDPEVRGQIAESLGRMRADSADVVRTAETLAGLLPARGAVRGLFFLARQRPVRALVPGWIGGRLQEVATAAGTPENVRYTAAAARLALGGATPEELATLQRDASADVRALVASAESIEDPSPIVRYRAVAVAGCPALVAATRDAEPHVALAAVDALAKCTRDASAVAALEANGSPRAVVSLAAVAPDRARSRVTALAGNADPFARTYAARAARRLADTATLRRLARDANPNVASEAVDGLSAVAGHAEDATYAAALRSNAPQLVMSAAKALAGSAQTAPLVAALDRLTARRRETERDARMALVDALGKDVPARYATDFDPAIATRVAALTGATAAPRPLPEAPVPTVAQLRALHGATLEMADGGVVELRLFPMDAPTNAWRFARLARAGYFDGLTFHRVVPWFVVQGGSPLANEYAGDGAFSRDEVGLENRRGTVGISTRGRDTGDGQLYFNTVDNVRLDHDYTVFAEVVRGMDVVDRMQEGARIRKVTVR